MKRATFPYLYLIIMFAAAALADYMVLRPYVMAPLYTVPVLYAARRLPPRHVLVVALIAIGMNTASGLLQGTPREVLALYTLGLAITVYLAMLLARQRRTARRFALAAAAGERLRFQAQLLDAVGQAVVATDVDGRITYWNRAAEQLYGWRRDEVLGRPVADVTPAVSSQEEAAEIMRRLGAGERWSGEFRLRRRDGTEFPALVTDTPVIGPGGRLEGVIGITADLTEEKAQAERLQTLYTTLQDAHAELQATQQRAIQQERLRALGQMASGIAHDFNNALAPVLGFSELLLALPGALDDREKTRSYLELIHTSAQDAAGVVRRLREFYRPRDEREIFGLVDLPTLLEDVAALTRPGWKDQAQAQGRTIAVTVDAGPHPRALPPIAGDTPALREALANLVFNAADAMPQGGTITLRAYQSEGPPGDEGRRTKDESDSSFVFRRSSPGVVVEVSDTGTGMTEDVRQRCLDPFFSTKGERGTGLGLAMVHGIARRHDATLEVDSAPGSGTTVRLRFPAVATAPAATEPGAPGDTPGDASGDASGDSDSAGAVGTADANQESGVATGGASTPRGRTPGSSHGVPPLRVLVVDDDESVRRVTAAYLATDGHQVTQAENGSAALEAFRAAPFDVVLTDRAMPGMNGDQLAELIKRASPAMPVILLTGFGDLMDAAGEAAVYVDRVLGKPVMLATLRATLAEVCGLAHPPATRDPVGCAAR